MKKTFQEEFFELSLGTEGHRISTEELIAYLSNTKKLINSINETFNKKYSLGYNQIEIDVIALKEGSFKIPLCIRKITNNATFAAIVSSILSSLLTGNNETQTIKNGEDEIQITSEELLENKKTANAVGKIAKMTVESPRIKDLTITYEKDDGEKEQITINKRTLSQVMYDEIEDDTNSNIITNATLEIVSPVFINAPAVWKVNYEGKLINVHMNDLDFIKKVELQKLSFAPGDEIIADIEVKAKTTARGTRRSYNIITVHSYPKFSRIIRDNPKLLDD